MKLGLFRRLGIFLSAPFWLVWALGCAPNSARPDGGGSADASLDGAPRRIQDAAPPLSDGICARVHLDASRSTPNVILMIDQSSSMTGDFGGRNRWISLRDSIMAPSSGLVASLESEVRFGLGIFTARRTPEICPWLPVVVEPALDNFNTIDEAYSIHTPMGGTPTGPAIDALLTQIAPTLDASGEPTILILATDGEPRLCAGGDLAVEGGRAEALSAVGRAYARGVRTFLISVGEDEIAVEHMQDLANAGAGVPIGSRAPFWVAGTESGLTSALDAIVGGELSCTFELMGRLRPELACTGQVLLNGRELRCGEDWRALDENHLEVMGAACDELTAGGEVVLDASFPCDVILI